MKHINLSILAVVVFIYSGCSPRRYATNETMPIVKTPVIIKPQVAEINIETRKVEGAAEVKLKDYSRNANVAEQACKDLAIKNAIVNGSCDVLVQPVYEIEQSKRNIKVKVSGFAGVYKKFREMNASDSTALLLYKRVAGSVLLLEVVTPTNSKFKNPFSKRR